MRPRANYVTNLSLSRVSGGWSGFNAAMFASLSRHYDMKYVGPIAPPPDLFAKTRSKISRILGRPGNFQFFSQRRLDDIARIVRGLADASATLDFFHGTTPWIAYAPAAPYACYLDVCFSTYISVYHDRAQFDERDIQRIARAESAWMRRAARVFFSSRWALNEAINAYDLDDGTLRVAGLGGHIPIPDRDVYVSGREFLFIALDFAGKGGQLCVDAFQIVRNEIPNVTLRIVGERPPSHVLGIPGVFYEGRLNKSVPTELERLQALLAAAFVLVHPTTKDATPQVIIEAEYHGCPVIAPRSFGIPDMVIDGVTGFLVPAPPIAADVADQMLWMCRNSEGYAKMRVAARTHALQGFTWEQVGDRIADELALAMA